MSPVRRGRSDPDPLRHFRPPEPPPIPGWVKAWFAFCGLLALAVLIGIGMLGYEAIQWLRRN